MGMVVAVHHVSSFAIVNTALSAKLLCKLEYLHYSTFTNMWQ